MKLYDCVGIHSGFCVSDVPDRKKHDIGPLRRHSGFRSRSFRFFSDLILNLLWKHTACDHQTGLSFWYFLPNSFKSSNQKSFSSLLSGNLHQIFVVHSFSAHTEDPLTCQFSRILTLNSAQLFRHCGGWWGQTYMNCNRSSRMAAVNRLTAEMLTGKEL